MQTLKYLFGLFAFFFCVNTAHSQKPKVELDGTQVTRFTSAINNQQYVLYIRFPNDSIKPNKKYPVLYVTDGQWFFTSLYAGYGGLRYDGLNPDIIIVGIAFSSDYENSRSRDMSPTPAKPVSFDTTNYPGGAPKFLSVIKNEVIRYIDSTYPTDTSKRCLYGTSMGGLFAIYSLFQEPTLFNQYIIASPYVQFNHDWIFKFEKNFAAKNKTLNAKVFFSIGELERKDYVNSYKKFVNQISATKYKGLVMKSMTIPNMSHSSTSTVGAIFGLRYIYGKPDIALNNDLLDKYVGHYMMCTGKIAIDTVTILRSGSHLFVINESNERVKLLAESPQRFSIEGDNVVFEFKKDHNKVTGLEVIIHDEHFLSCKRID